MNTWQDNEAKNLFQNIPHGASIPSVFAIGLILSFGHVVFLINQNQGYLGLKYGQLWPAYFASILLSAVIYFWPSVKDQQLRGILSQKHPDRSLIDNYQRNRVLVAPIVFVGALSLQLFFSAATMDSGRDVVRFAAGNAGMAVLASFGIWACASWWRVSKVLKQANTTL